MSLKKPHEYMWRLCNSHVVGDDVSSVGKFPKSCWECALIKEYEEGVSDD